MAELILVADTSLVLCAGLLKPILVRNERELRRHSIGSWHTMTTMPMATLSVWKGISPRS